MPLFVASAILKTIGFIVVVIFLFGFIVGMIARHR